MLDWRFHGEWPRGFEGSYYQILKPDDLMYPCSAVEEVYKAACYSFQTSYVFKVTGNLENALVECRRIPDQYKDICFESVGRDVAGMVELDIERTKSGCLSLTEQKLERESCVSAAVKVLIHHYRSDAEGIKFCSSLPQELRKVCFDTAAIYLKVISVQ